MSSHFMRGCCFCKTGSSSALIRVGTCVTDGNCVVTAGRTLSSSCTRRLFSPLWISCLTCDAMSSPTSSRRLFGRSAEKDPVVSFGGSTTLSSSSNPQVPSYIAMGRRSATCDGMPSFGVAVVASTLGDDVLGDSSGWQRWARRWCGRWSAETRFFDSDLDLGSSSRVIT